MLQAQAGTFRTPRTAIVRPAGRECRPPDFECFAFDPLLFALLGEPFSCLCDGACVQFRDDPPRTGGALSGAFGIGSRARDAKGAAHLPRLLCPVYLDGEAILLDALSLTRLTFRGLSVAEGMFSVSHFWVGVGLLCCDRVRPFGDGVPG